MELKNIFFIIKLYKYNINYFWTYTKTNHFTSVIHILCEAHNLLVDKDLVQLFSEMIHNIILCSDKIKQFENKFLLPILEDLE